MNGHCSLEDCGIHQGLSCELGHTELPACPHFKPASGKVPESGGSLTPDESPTQRLPWTGRALGLSDMMLVTSRSSASLIGLIGPFNAGKTSFLTALFTHFSKTGFVNGFSFAGSYTLGAWSQLRQYTEWPAQHGPSFPPHTPDTADRVPSLLHLALRNEGGTVRDLLFTDAPGEWFSRWILNRTSTDSEGAIWIAQHATHFLFFIDRAALSGSNVGKVRQDTLALARILAEHSNNRPIIVIWAKSDQPIAEDTERPIRAKLKELFGPHASIDVQVEDLTSLLVLEEILSQPDKPPSTPSQSELPISLRTSAFMSYRGTSP